MASDPWYMSAILQDVTMQKSVIVKSHTTINLRIFFFGSTSVLSTCRLFHVFMFILSFLSRIQELTKAHTATNGRHLHVFFSGPALILWGLSSFASYLGRCSAQWAEKRTWLSSSSP